MSAYIKLMKRVDQLEQRIALLEACVHYPRPADLDSTVASVATRPANEKRRRSEESTTAPALYDACCETSAVSS